MNSKLMKTYHGEIGREIPLDWGVERTYHGEIGREATAVAKMLHTTPSLPTGKSVGKPRRRNTSPQQTGEATTRKSVGKPASQMRMEAETGRHECDLAATVPNVCMRNGKSP
jgi:hypothetical protein